ncbi:16S rRNA G966 N2-methylase RsmD [Peribacillus deserti]|uniref:16S rRNA G966 N2-methylase RsmD n=1 Tax=Peribacillus deserti TaxID=673318 RepID=A0ABS2QHB8_9BACI|nr:class I SAM-dependent methyltransferase [Peribacillus deserti]MBM7692553.1 16S rRNA G966 N2-methylase RsmD [Peribacillus deserti]
MLVTTGGRTDKEWMETAIQIAADLKVPFVPRRKRSIAAMQQEYQEDCLVVGKNRIELYEMTQDSPFFFHPNAAMLRLKRIKKGENDPLIEAADLKAGMSFLDCTLGLASDSIVASFIAGETGSVSGIEANPNLAFIVKRGLLQWDSANTDFNKAMRRINIQSGNHVEILKSMDSKSVDVIYFDPMFEETIKESNGIRALAGLALHETLTNEAIHEAKRVCSKRVILKDHFKSHRFNEFGFKVFKRKSSKFHFGVIELKE